jgi:hypothetical protein
MGKNEKTPITINDVEYYIEDFTDQQKVLINHVQDLDRKMGSAQFNLDQLRVGRESFVKMLVEAVETTEEE